MPDSAPRGDRPEPDAAFVARFAAAYRGRSSAEDALWWWDHPMIDAPAGARSPAANAEECRRALFAPGAGAAEHAAYEAAARCADEERAATRAALEEIGVVVDREDAAADDAEGTAASRRGSDGIDSVPADPDDSVPDEIREGEESLATRARRRRGWLRPAALIGVLAFVIGGAVTIGLQAVGTVVGYDGPGAAPTPSATLANPQPAGRLLATLASTDRDTGSDGSGFTSYRSTEVDARGKRVQLGVTCRGDGTIVVVIGSGFITGSYYAIQCGSTGDSGLRTQLPTPATSEPFRVSVFQRDPLQWKVALTATDGF